MAICRFENRALKEVALYPADMGFGQPRSQRGRPLLADHNLAKVILDRVSRFSEPYGTKIDLVDGKGIVRLGKT